MVFSTYALYFYPSFIFNFFLLSCLSNDNNLVACILLLSNQSLIFFHSFLNSHRSYSHSHSHSLTASLSITSLPISTLPHPPPPPQLDSPLPIARKRTPTLPLFSLAHISSNSIYAYVFLIANNPAVPCFPLSSFFLHVASSLICMWYMRIYPTPISRPQSATNKPSTLTLFPNTPSMPTCHSLTHFLLPSITQQDKGPLSSF